MTRAPERHDLVRHARAAVVLLAAALMFLGATPLCDTTVGKNYATPEQRQAYRDEIGWPWSEIVITAAWINRNGRDRAHRMLAILETPLGIEQYWNLYPIWGTLWRQLEVTVDGEVVFRSADPVYTWQRGILHQHRVTYQINGALGGKRPRALAYTLDWIVQTARADFPEATEVAVSVRADQLPARNPRVIQRFEARAPEWELEQVLP